MLCLRCCICEGTNFGLYCQRCKDYLTQEHQRKLQNAKERRKLFRYKGGQYADNCATCHREETTLWIVSFGVGDAVAGESFSFGATGPVTGVWCDECIAGMVGNPEIESGLTFKGIHDIQFLKKCYEPQLDTVALQAVEVLRGLDF